MTGMVVVPRADTTVIPWRKLWPDLAIDVLTPAERECLARTVLGQTPAEIAAALGWEKHSVQVRLSEARNMLGITGRNPLAGVMLGMLVKRLVRALEVS